MYKFRHLIALATVLLVFTACGSDDDGPANTGNNNNNNNSNPTPDNGNTPTNGKITLKYDGKTLESAGESTGTGMGVLMGTLLTQTNAKWAGSDDNSPTVSVKVILRNPTTTAFTAGAAYPLLPEDDLEDATPNAGSIVILAHDLISADETDLESLSGTVHLESIKIENNIAKSATYRFDGKFVDRDNANNTYDLSGNVVYVFKQ